MEKTKLTFDEALAALRAGQMVKLPEWVGYWFNAAPIGEDMVIKVFDRHGDILDTPYLEDYKNRTDWENTDGRRDFGGALLALKAGKLVAREGWNGKGMFIAKQILATIGLDIIPKMQSLPQAAKDMMVQRNQPISYTNQMLIVNADGRADSWVPSSSDCFAEDWFIVQSQL